MTPHEIGLGTRFELEILDINGEKVGRTYISQLLEHQDDNLLIISAPISEARLVYIPDNMPIRLTFVHNPQGLLGFSAMVRSKVFRGNIAMMIVEPENGVDKIQRRMNYRLDVVLDVLMWLPDPNEKNPIKAYTKNVSGSGLCVISEINIPKRTEIKVELSLAKDLSISAKCAILRNIPTELRKGKGYELGMNFTDISMKSQDVLIKFLFDRQRLLIKKDK